MYNQTQWFDRVTEYEDRSREVQNPDGSITHEPVEGEVIQVGTPQNQTNFNNAENGIQDSHIAHAIFAFWNYHHIPQADAENEMELLTVTLTNSQSQPFNSTVDNPVTVALSKAKKNLFYAAEVEVLEHDGLVGEIHVSDKALNGFKLCFTGSGTSVKLAVRVKGGTM